MKCTKIILCCFSLIYLPGCVDSIKERVDDPEFLKGIKSITIYNKTQNELIPHSIEIKDASKISKIMDELRNLEDYSFDNFKANFGFYELDINYSNRKSYEVDIIYTVYHGVVIDDMSGKTYKNDHLESLVEFYFQ